MSSGESGRLFAPGAHGRVLVVDDDPVTCQLLDEVLRGEGFEVERALSGGEALRMHRARPFDAVVSDIRMGEGQMTGLEVLKTMKRETPEVVVVIITGFGSMESAIEAIREGAFDYVSKPFKIEEVKLAVRRGLEQRRRLEAMRPAAEEGGAPSVGVRSLVGRSRAMLEVYKLIAMVAPARTTVLIVGESGTGKELVARAIHENGPRKEKPFLAVNCAALPEHLLESELFGHARGAFTSAVAEKRGLFEEASGGTLFLDEIADTTLALQSKLLRALQEQEIRPVGSNVPRKVDVRVIAATNRDLRHLVGEAKFREDLFYRLNVVTIAMPPLRERPGDIPLLIEHFLKKYARQAGRPVVPTLAPEALEALKRYTWPGNVRELEHAIERAVTLSPHSAILLEHLPEAVRGAPPIPTLEEIEREHIERVLRQTGGNMKSASEILGIDRKTLYRKAKQFGLRAD
jgi:DNA-binding NtrC family response regulator